MKVMFLDRVIFHDGMKKKKIKNLNQNQKLLKNSEFNEIYREYIK